MILGIPHAVKSHVHIGPTGVDELNAVLMSYSSGATAVFTSSQRLDAPIEAEIIGTEGYIKLPDRFFYGKQVTLKVGDKSQTFNLPYDSNGCIHQIREVHACLRSGKLESAVMPLDETLAIMQLMDTLREEWDLTYPGESL
jgi:predicted dehydrogenase